MPTGRPIGSGLREDVRHETRECDIHGEQLHAQVYSGKGSNPRWDCMKCARERRARCTERKQRGIKPREYTHALPEIKAPTCNIHFVALPKTGICDFC